jgi:hypothetical protein
MVVDFLKEIIKKIEAVCPEDYVNPPSEFDSARERKVGLLKNEEMKKLFTVRFKLIEKLQTAQDELVKSAILPLPQQEAALEKYFRDNGPMIAEFDVLDMLLLGMLECQYPLTQKLQASGHIAIGLRRGWVVIRRLPEEPPLH